MLMRARARVCRRRWWRGDWLAGLVREAGAEAQGGAWAWRLAASAAALTALAVMAVARPAAAAALETARILLFQAGLMASAIRQRSPRRGGTLAGEASGGGWREWRGCSGNALRWLP